MTLLIESTIEASILVLLALAALRLPPLRKAPAALRHWVLASALLCAAVSPLVGLAVPASWQVTIPAAAPAIGRDAAAAAERSTSPRTAPHERSAAARVEPAAAAAGWRMVLIWAWLAGVAASLTTLAAGFVQLARIAGRSRRLTEGPWMQCADEIRREYGIRQRVAMFYGDDPPLLVTWGLLKPKLLLPAAAAAWDEARMRIVLRHELAHVRRRDAAIQLGAEILRAVHWFNPAIWMACAQLRQESERACDDAVLNRGVESAEYAGHLVEIARDFSGRRQWAAAPAMARASSLERRVRAMLDVRANRRPVPRAVRAATLIALLGVTIPVAGFAAQAVFSRVGGSIVDPSNAALPGVTLVLTNQQTKSKYEVTSDRTGRYEFVGVPPGDYVFEAKLRGFASMQGSLKVSGQDVQQDVKLEVGTLQETVSVAASRSGAAAGTAAAAAAPIVVAREKRTAAPCSMSLPTDGPAIGGNIRVPRKLKHVSPVYPANLIVQGVAGAVRLQGTIGRDGYIDQVDVVSTPHPDLGTAAANAVRQWEFDPTLLNCDAIPVTMKVTVNFTITE